MRRKGLINLLAAFAAALMVTSPVLAQDTLHLTLEDALQIARSENRTVKVAGLEIRKKMYARKGTYAALFPQIDFSFSYQRALKKQTFYMEDQAFEIGRANTWSTGFQATMPIINVQLWKAIQVTALDVELAVEKAVSSHQELVNQVEQSFYSVLLSKQLYDVYRENYQNALDNYNETKAKYEQGLASKFDFLRSEVTMQNAEPAMHDAQNNVVLNNWKLKAVIGIDLDAVISCVGSLSDYESAMDEVIDRNLSIENNSTLKQLEIQEEMLHKNYQMQLAKYYPTLGGSVGYNWMTMDEKFQFNDYQWSPFSTGALSINIPIFSGGKRFNDVRQVKVQQEQLRLQKEEAVRNLEVGMVQILNSLETTVKQYEAAQKTIESAEAGYEIAKKRYEVGSGTLLELNDAQLGLLQARLNLNQSVYTYLTLKSNLDKLLGVHNN